MHFSKLKCLNSTALYLYASPHDKQKDIQLNHFIECSFMYFVINSIIDMLLSCRCRLWSWTAHNVSYPHMVLPIWSLFLFNYCVLCPILSRWPGLASQIYFFSYAPLTALGNPIPFERISIKIYLIYFSKSVFIFVVFFFQIKTFYCQQPWWSRMRPSLQFLKAWTREIMMTKSLYTATSIPNTSLWWTHT